MLGGVVLAVVQQAGARSCGGHHVRTAGDERNGQALCKIPAAILLLASASRCVAFPMSTSITYLCSLMELRGLGMTFWFTDGIDVEMEDSKRPWRCEIPAIIIDTRPGVIAWLPYPCRYQRLGKEEKKRCHGGLARTGHIAPVSTPMELMGTAGC